MFTVKRERQIASIILTHSHLILPSPDGGPSLVLSSPKKIAYSLTAKIGKLSTSGRERAMSSRAARLEESGEEWNGDEGDWRKWGKNVPPERNCQAWMSAMGGNRFLKNTRVRNCLQKFKTREKRYRAWGKFRRIISRIISREKCILVASGEEDYKNDFENIYKKDYRLFVETY